MDDFVGVSNGRYDTVTRRPLQYPIAPLTIRKRSAVRVNVNARVAAWRQDTERHASPNRAPMGFNSFGGVSRHTTPKRVVGLNPSTVGTPKAPPKRGSLGVGSDSTLAQDSVPDGNSTGSRLHNSPVQPRTPAPLHVSIPASAASGNATPTRPKFKGTAPLRIVKRRVTPPRPKAASVGLGLGICDELGNPFSGLGLLSEHGKFRRPVIMRRAEFVANRRHYNRCARRPQPIQAAPPQLVVDSPQPAGEQGLSPFLSSSHHVRCCRSHIALETPRKKNHRAAGARRTPARSPYARKRREAQGVRRDAVHLESVRHLLVNSEARQEMCSLLKSPSASPTIGEMSAQCEG
ncbi:hypothetical protein HGRIS_008934 [Hohenbuehelia grisea]